MSSIEKLQIRGIRSFDVESNDHIINFQSPLTLILGANGCGKTTIVECLKYALTGDVPLGTDKGKYFVNDVTVSKLKEVKGQVKLQIRKNIQGENVTVSRSMKVSQKSGDKIEFKSQDSTLSFMKNGKKVESISKRIEETNEFVCEAIGVSKAVLNNVIFCHQEDSNWPLDDDKKVKEKFDAIFGTSEYDKAVTKIIDVRKSLLSKQKLAEVELKHLEHLKNENDQKTLQLRRVENDNEKLEEENKKIEESIKPIDKKIEQLDKLIQEKNRLYTKQVTIQAQIKSCKDSKNSLKAKIKNIFTGDADLLDDKIRSFKREMDGKSEQLKNIEEDLVAIKAQERKLQNELTELNAKNSKLSYDRQQEQDLNSERAGKIQDLSEKLEIPINCDLENSNEDVSEILNKIKSGLQKEESVIAEISKNNDKIDREQQIEIDSLRDKRTTLSTNIYSKNALLKKQNEEKLKNLSEINSVEKSASILKKLTREIEEISNEFDEFSKSINLDEMRDSILVKKKKRDELQDKVEKLDEKINFLNSFSKITTEINIKQEQLGNRQAEIKRIKNRNSDNLKSLFPKKVIESDFKRNVQSSYSMIEKEIKDLNKKISDFEKKAREYDFSRKNLKVELTKAEKELTAGEEKVFDSCRSTPYEEILAKLKETIEKLQLDYGAFNSSEILFKKYIQKIEEDPCCPLCENSMTHSAATDLSSRLTEDIRSLPEKIESTSKRLKAEQKKYENLLQLKPTIEKINKLKIEIPKMKLNLKQTEENFDEASTQAEELQFLLVEPESNSQLANSMLGDMSLLDEALKELTRIENDIKTLKGKLPSNRSDSLTIDEAQSQRTSFYSNLKTERIEMEKLEKKLNSNSDKLNSLREKKNSMKDQQIKLQEGVQALSQFKLRQEELGCTIAVLITEIQDLQNDLLPLKTQLERITNQKIKTKEENRQKLNLAQTKLQNMKKIDDEIKRCTNQLNDLIKLDLTKQIQLVKNLITKVTDEQKKKSLENDKKNTEKENISKQISEQRLIERDLTDNKELKKLEEDLKIHEEKYSKLMTEIGDSDCTTADKQRNDLIGNRNSLVNKQSNISGQKDVKINQIKAITAELKNEKYKNSLNNYRKVLYKVAVTKKVINDLTRYRKALENGLLEYHSQKMKQINRLIREFWREIYRGNDIDYIQIQTKAGKEKDLANVRRNYTYSVVQIKQDVQIEMKGRCSAGQRVLACLIIRMALAETFSTNCGVLALDEPTTNLDRENIVSLCNSLNKLVEDRQAQSNFMLIVITHDDEFIKMLGKVESYYKLTRDNDGKSIIDKVRVNY